MSEYLREKKICQMVISEFLKEIKPPQTKKIPNINLESRPFKI